MKTKLEDYICFVLNCKMLSFFQLKQRLFYNLIHSQHSKKFSVTPNPDSVYEVIWIYPEKNMHT